VTVGEPSSAENFVSRMPFLHAPEAGETSIAQFRAVCRRSKMVAMGPRRSRGGSRRCRRWALQRRGETPCLRQIWRATKRDKV